MNTCPLWKSKFQIPRPMANNATLRMHPWLHAIAGKKMISIRTFRYFRNCGHKRSDRFGSISRRTSRKYIHQIPTWRVIWGLIMTNGRLKLTLDQYQSISLITDTFRMLPSSAAPEDSDNTDLDIQRIDCLPHYSTVVSVGLQKWTYERPERGPEISPKGAFLLYQFLQSYQASMLEQTLLAAGLRPYGINKHSNWLFFSTYVIVYKLCRPMAFSCRSKIVLETSIQD